VRESELVVRIERSRGVKIREIEAKTILVRSKLPDADYVVHPYTGCEFGCLYCYASFMGFVGESMRAWGDYEPTEVREVYEGASTDAHRQALDTMVHKLVAKHGLRLPLAGVLDHGADRRVQLAAMEDRMSSGPV
jgi:hypothetical protein